MPIGVDGEAACSAQLPPAVAEVVDPVEVGDVALAQPEGVGKRAEGAPDRAASVGGIGRGVELGVPFAPPVVAQAGGHEQRGESRRWRRQRSVE